MSTLKAANTNFQNWVRKQFILEKLANPLGVLILLFFCLIISLGISLVNVKGAILFVGAIIAIPVIFLCATNIWFSLVVMMITAYMVPFFGKFVNAPIGLSLDGLLGLMAFSLVVNLARDKDWSFAKHPISLLIIIWIYYNLFQLLNPWAQSKMAWLYTVRTLAVMQFVYFVACYALNTRRKAMNMIIALVVMAFICALYGLKQEFVGMSAAELQWLYADEKRFQLIVQWGRFRIFSFCSDPTTLGILMAYMGTVSYILALGPIHWVWRVCYVIMGTAMMMAMAYAGSRTPFVLVPAGIVFYVVCTMKKEVLLGSVVMLALGSLAMMKSTSNPVLYRIQSAFKPGEDASVQVRLDNQALIQPYIQTHPIGAGLGSTGVWGKRFTPDSWLASFAHDSSYVRIAVEMGYIGLILYMVFLFFVAKYTLRYYFRARDPLIKNMYLAMATAIFMIILASYPQEVIPLPPTSVIFFILLGAIVRLKDFDPVVTGEELPEAKYKSF